jgi:hypothetical protein
VAERVSAALSCKNCFYKRVAELIIHSVIAYNKLCPYIPCVIIDPWDLFSKMIIDDFIFEKKFSSLSSQAEEVTVDILSFTGIVNYVW